MELHVERHVPQPLWGAVKVIEGSACRWASKEEEEEETCRSNSPMNEDDKILKKIKVVMGGKI